MSYVKLRCSTLRKGSFEIVTMKEWVEFASFILFVEFCNLRQADVLARVPYKPCYIVRVESCLFTATRVPYRFYTYRQAHFRAVALLSIGNIKSKLLCRFSPASKHWWNSK